MILLWYFYEYFYINYEYHAACEYIAVGRVLASEALTSVKLMQTRPGSLSSRKWAIYKHMYKYTNIQILEV